MDLTKTENPITVRQMIEALQELRNQDAVVNIIVKQNNKVYGKVANVSASKNRFDSYFWVTEHYSGCAITINLEEGISIMDRRKSK